ncbi:MAG: metallophosphatase family protein [Tepidanaerobacteraceae bacterium]|jgi:putative phosphoesterase|nr:metallophosphatase family protein [Tepidanaerobacteraceae bacterium]
MAEHTIGVISDTHGILRPEILQVFKDCGQIIHAGDIGDPHIIDSLGKIASVYAVRGNCDRDGWAYSLPLTKIVEIGDVCIYLMHDLNRLDLDPKAAGFDAVISGHTHRPLLECRNGVMFLNPGSAGPKRFNLPISAARLRIKGKSIEAEFIKLDD